MRETPLPGAQWHAVRKTSQILADFFIYFYLFYAMFYYIKKYICSTFFLFLLIAARTVSPATVWDTKNQQIKTKLRTNVDELQPYLDNMERRIERMNGRVQKLREDVREMHRSRRNVK